MTFRLDSRSLDILDLLVASERPLAAVDIANHLNISARMVRSSLAAAEPWIRAGHTTLERTPGKGYSIRGSDRDRRNLAQLIREYDRPLLWLSSSERLYILLLALFFTDKPLQIKQLQQMLNLSRTSTLGVLDAAETWLEDFPLALIRRPNYGCMISGAERDWREAVIRLLQESAGDARLLALCRGMKTVVEVSYRKQMGLEEHLLNTWRQLDIPLIRQLISPFEHTFEGRLSDQDYLRFFLYMAVVVYRNRIGKSNCTIPEAPRGAGTAQTLPEVEQLAARVHSQFGIQLPVTELAWMALQMPEPAPAQHPTGEPADSVNPEHDSFVRGLVDQILHQSALSLHPSLPVDLELIHNLTVHVAALRRHMQLGRSSDHPLLKEVKDQYPYVYSVAAQCGSFLTERLGRAMTETEIGDMAICLVAAMERLRLLERRTRKVLVVCSAGAVTAWLLVSRLRAEFPNVEVVDVISALDLESRKHLDGVDYIVSTIPLRGKNVPTLQVRPLLGLDDCKRLKVFFDRSQPASPAHKLPDISTMHLSDLLTPEMITLGVIADNWQDVVEKAGTKLLETDAIEATFVQAMKQTILEHGPYMVIWPGVVLLHAPPRGVRRLCMQFINLRRPVCFGHSENDPVYAAIVLGAVDTRSHIPALLELNRMLQDEKARSELQRALHKTVILHWVSRYSK